MHGIGIVNHKETTIEEMLNRKDTRYVVPFFQREYSWTKDDWIDFLNDLNEAKKNKLGHFFGFMALQRHDSEIDIIEGQQRITTVTILVAVVRDILREKRHDSANDIERDYIKTADTLSETAEVKYKLELSEINKGFFREFIQEYDTPSQKFLRSESKH